MTTWTVAARTMRGTHNIIGTADTTAAGQCAALRCAHALNAGVDNPYTHYDIHVDHQLLAIVSATDNTPSGRAATHHLLDRLHHAINPYSY